MTAKLYFCVPSPLKKLVLALQSLKMSCFYFTFCSWSYKTTNKVSGWRNFSPATAKYVSGKRALGVVWEREQTANIKKTSMHRTRQNRIDQNRTGENKTEKNKKTIKLTSSELEDWKVHDCSVDRNGKNSTQPTSVSCSSSISSSVP